MGRPKTEEKRTKFVKVYLSEKELKKLNLRAQKANHDSLSVFVRKIALNREFKPFYSTEELKHTANLRQIGNNLNQIARALNQKGLVNPNYEIISDIEEQVNEIKKILISGKDEK